MAVQIFREEEADDGGEEGGGEGGGEDHPLVAGGEALDRRRDSAPTGLRVRRDFPTEGRSRILSATQARRACRTTGAGRRCSRLLPAPVDLVLFPGRVSRGGVGGGKSRLLPAIHTSLGVGVDRGARGGVDRR